MCVCVCVVRGCLWALPDTNKDDDDKRCHLANRSNILFTKKYEINNYFTHEIQNIYNINYNMLFTNLIFCFHNELQRLETLNL